MLPPGSTIGILGGGQLGRMTAMAAARLGYRTHVFATEPDAPAAQVAGAATIAPSTLRMALHLSKRAAHEDLCSSDCRAT